MLSLALKSLFLLPLIFIVDYIVMILIGCVSCYFGAATDFYECSFCTIGKFVLLISAILFIAILFPDIKSLFKKPRVS
jgi:hypothetical protein